MTKKKYFSDYTVDLYLKTEPIDQKAAEKAVFDMYEYCKMEPPMVVYVRGLRELEDAIKCWSFSMAMYKEPGLQPMGPKGLDLEHGSLVDLKGDPIALEKHNDIAHFYSGRGRGRYERMKSAVRQSVRGVSYTGLGEGLWGAALLPVNYIYGDDSDREKREKKSAYKWDCLASKIWDETYFIVSYEHVCFIVERPEVIYHNESGFHRLDGPAVIFADGSEIYCYEGEVVGPRLITDPDSATLADVHQGNGKRHRLIELIGVDWYLSLVHDFKIDAKGKLQRFFHFSEIDKKNPEERKYWNERGYEVTIHPGTVNGQYGLRMESDRHTSFIFYNRGDIFKDEHVGLLFDEHDRDLWQVLNLNEMFSRMRGADLIVGYKEGEFYVTTKAGYYVDHPACSHDVCPSWFKVFIRNGIDAVYEGNGCKVEVKDGKLNVLEIPDPHHDSLFGGNCNVPSFKFNLDIRSDTWEGLLEKWAHKAFNWLALHENSTCLP